MSAEEFWHGQLDLARAYREAWRIRRENERDELFASEWRRGIYNMLGFSTVMEHAFSKSAKSEYPESPLFSSEGMREAVRAEREEAAMRRAVEAFKARVAKINERFAERQGDGAEGEG